MTYSTPQVTEQEKSAPQGRSQKFRIAIAILVMLALSPLTFFDGGGLSLLLINIAGGAVYARLGKPVSKCRAAFESARFIAILTVAYVITATLVVAAAERLSDTAPEFIEILPGVAGIALIKVSIVAAVLLAVLNSLLGALGGFLSAVLRKDRPVTESQAPDSNLQPPDLDDPRASSTRGPSSSVNPRVDTSDPWA